MSRHRSVISATLEAVAGRMKVQGLLGLQGELMARQLLKVLSQNSFKRDSLVVKHLPRLHEVLGSNPSAPTPK